MKRPLFWVTLLAAALSIGLAACSGDSDSTEGSSDEDSHGVFPTGSPAAEPESTLAPEVTPTAALLAHIIFINGQVIMMDTGQPIAQALAVLGEEILLVATEQAVLALAGPDTQMIDLAGRALLPGFVDPHNHIYNQISRGLRQETIGATYGEAQQRLLAAGTTTVANGGVSPDRLDDFLPIVNSCVCVPASTWSSITPAASCCPRVGIWSTRRSATRRRCSAFPGSSSLPTAGPAGRWRSASRQVIRLATCGSRQRSWRRQ